MDIIEKLWTDYLSIIDNISKLGVPGLYAVENMRRELHEKLIMYYEKEIKNFRKKRFKLFTDNLDILVDFSPPIMSRGNSIRFYAKKMARWCYCQEGIYFLSGKTSRVTGINGILKNESD